MLSEMVGAPEMPPLAGTRAANLSQYDGLMCVLLSHAGPVYVHVKQQILRWKIRAGHWNESVA